MCFNTTKDKNLKKINQGFSPKVTLGIKHAGRFKPGYVLSAFQHDYLPVLRDPGTIEFFSWGFIQPTARDSKESAEIKLMTANAKCETVFEKPLYKQAIMERRCIIAVDGFFEWRHAFNKAYPHYIYPAAQPIMLMGGMWNEWVNTDTGEVTETVSMITTAANPMMEVIHNRKKRMPFIMNPAQALEWLNQDLNARQVQDLMQPYDEKNMRYHTTGKKLYPNAEETIAPVVYPELVNEQQSLF